MGAAAATSGGGGATGSPGRRRRGGGRFGRRAGRSTCAGSTAFRNIADARFSRSLLASTAVTARKSIESWRRTSAASRATAAAPWRPPVGSTAGAAGGRRSGGRGDRRAVLEAAATGELAGEIRHVEARDLDHIARAGRNPGTSDRPGTCRAGARRRRWRRTEVPPPLTPLETKSLPGFVVEGETLTGLPSHGDFLSYNVQILEVNGRLWSEHFQGLWYNASPGASVDLSFSAPEPGPYCVLGWLTHDPYGGLVDLSINGQSVAEDLDVCNDLTWIPAEAIPLGVHDLTSSANLLGVVVAGASCGAFTELGIDALSLIDVAGPVPLVLRLDRSTLTWQPHRGSSYDVVRGDLRALRASGGNFDAAGMTCLSDDGVPTSLSETDSPAPHRGWFYLVRARNCSVESYDSGGSGQVAPRDPTVLACP